MADEPVLPGLTEARRESQEDAGQADSIPRLRFEEINRDQLMMRVIDVEQLVGEDHPVRAIWEFVGRLDLSGFCKHVKAVEGEPGRPAYDPRLMVSLWIYAYSEGVSSAREIERRCEYHPAYQWLTGMKVVNHHSLSDFRVDHGEALQNLFAEILAVLHLEGLITLERVMHDGTKIKAAASPSTFKKEERVKRHLEMAREHVKEMEAQSEEGESRRAVKARQRAAREKVQQLESALEEFKKMGSSKRKEKEGRVSEVEPEARKMKQKGGGFAPSYNVQITADQHQGVIIGVGTSQSPGDYEELIPGMERVEANTGGLPLQAVTDGGYVGGDNIHAMRELGIDLIAPVPDLTEQLEKRGIAPAFQRQVFEYDEATNSYICPAGNRLGYKGKEQRGERLRYRYRASPGDCQACPFKQECCPESKFRSLMRLEHEAEVMSHRDKMETDEAKQIYKQRGQTAEFPIAWVKEKLGLRRFRVRGLTKAGLEAVWACITYNIQTWIRVRWRSRYLAVKT